MDFEAICDAIAARYAPGTLATPSGAQAMRASYGQAPHSMPATPAVVVRPRDGEVILGSGQVMGQHNIDVEFFLSKAPGDIERVETQRQKWLPYLLTATYGQLKLGLAGTVDKAIPMGWEFTELPYGGDSYYGIIVHLRVWTTETQALTP